MKLIDTNIFLEIFLKQGKREVCKKYLSDHQDEIAVTDLAIHSIAIILLRNGKAEAFERFIHEWKNMLTILKVEFDELNKVVDVMHSNKLDFEDAYQLEVAKENKLDLVTLDNHFKKSKDIHVIFL